MIQSRKEIKMQKMTKTGLIDKCINGDNNNLVIFGNMFDLFSCMYAALRNSGVETMPNSVVFTAGKNDALFGIDGDVTIDSDAKKESENIFGHKMEVQTSTEHHTCIRVCG